MNDRERKEPSRPVAARRRTAEPAPAGPFDELQRSVGNSAVARALEGSRGAALEPGVRRHFEGVLGVPLDDVRVHHGDGARTAARALDARAFTVGSEVVVGDGSNERAVLAHELVHVAQRRLAGGSRPGVSEPGEGAERECRSHVPSTLEGRPVTLGAAPSAVARLPMYGPDIEIALAATVATDPSGEGVGVDATLGSVDQGSGKMPLGPVSVKSGAVTDEAGQVNYGSTAQGGVFSKQVQPLGENVSVEYSGPNATAGLTVGQGGLDLGAQYEAGSAALAYESNPGALGAGGASGDEGSARVRAGYSQGAGFGARFKGDQYGRTQIGVDVGPFTGDIHVGGHRGPTSDAQSHSDQPVGGGPSWEDRGYRPPEPTGGMPTAVLPEIPTPGADSGWLGDRAAERIRQENAAAEARNAVERQEAEAMNAANAGKSDVYTLPEVIVEGDPDAVRMPELQVKGDPNVVFPPEEDTVTGYVP